MNIFGEKWAKIFKYFQKTSQLVISIFDFGYVTMSYFGKQKHELFKHYEWHFGSLAVDRFQVHLLIILKLILRPILKKAKE